MANWGLVCWGVVASDQSVSGFPEELVCSGVWLALVVLSAQALLSGWSLRHLAVSPSVFGSFGMDLLLFPLCEIVA